MEWSVANRFKLLNNLNKDEVNSNPRILPHPLALVARPYSAPPKAIEDVSNSNLGR